MPEDFIDFDQSRLRNAAKAELEHIRSLGSDANLTFVTANRGAYEAILYIISANESGVPVYEALTNVKSGYSTQSGVLARLKAMRQLGLIESRPGHKKSQTCLIPSPTLLRDLGALLLKRHGEE